MLPHPGPNTDLAERDLEAITRLLDTPAFEAYFCRRLRERRKHYAQQLEEDQTAEQTAALRTRMKEIDEILRMPAQDRGTHTATMQMARRQ